ncbi:MAG: glutamate-5-semialdehyde dehydrogenase [Rickettsiales bacterium]|nr:glutamate-5-semialdehyde dehydrogenase [Rickettsiales bacterium]
MNITEKTFEICERAKIASSEVALKNSETKNKALRNAAASIMDYKKNIIAENQKDLDSLSPDATKAFIDRLKLDENRISAIAKGLNEIAELPDPVGKILASWKRPNGLEISRVATPIGVVGIIYESRPNVTADAGGLCLKSGNTCVLRGGSDSINSSIAILEALKQGLKSANITQDAIQLIPFKEREAVGAMLRASQYIDVIVPRGGKGLIQRVIDESKIPLFQHLDGNNHTYIHKSADLEMAVKVLHNAKMRRTGVCGATETLVIDIEIIDKILPKIIEILTNSCCEIRGDELISKLDYRIIPANNSDWDTEYLDSIIAVKSVGGLEDAIKFIKQHSSGHTDAIIAEDKSVAEVFLKVIDSAIVMHNTSTQFADGGEFGMGAEIGIATGKLHARGPVGVEQLCTFKYIVRGDGQVRG